MLPERSGFFIYERQNPIERQVASAARESRSGFGSKRCQAVEGEQAPALRQPFGGLRRKRAEARVATGRGWAWGRSKTVVKPN